MMLSKMDINEGISKSIEELHVTTAKGKRTKRLRPWSPCAVAGAAAVTSSSSSGAADSSSTIEGADQEEEDMANCLILLAQGRGEERVIIPHHNKQKEGEMENHVGDDNKSMMMMTEKTTKIGFYVYECKTCNRTFPSFQALGGHRASHKKPKATVTQEEKKSPPPPPPAPRLTTSTSTRDFEETRQTHVPHRVSLELGVNLHTNKSTNSKLKIHECSICGAEFTSGQALGGHMRRHRAVQAAATVAASTGNNSAAVQIKPRIVLELDLNLPAPEDDLRDSAFQIPATATQKSMVLSAAPALVGCHY
ncbi:zinc finger protein ZAT5-like [Lotus japonicus]|uniref:zinc finger protein ZAT5-like n=1 Tax=Lotus japonicus TaxID=34305 RepID=UPI00258DA88C|nr:zinc finger protein ZAT5-like [Lotus japonicus]